MEAPVVFAHVAERGRDAALRRHGVRAGRENFCDKRGLEALFSTAETGAKACAPCADDDDIIFMIDDFVAHKKATFTTARTDIKPTITKAMHFAVIEAFRTPGAWT